MSFQSAPMEFKRIGDPLLPPCNSNKSTPAIIEPLPSGVRCKSLSPQVQRTQAIAMRTLTPAEANHSALRWSCQCQNGFCYCPMLR